MLGRAHKVMFSYGPLHIAEQKQSDQLEPTYSNSEDTRCSLEDTARSDEW